MLSNANQRSFKNVITSIGDDLAEIVVNPTISEKYIVTQSKCSGSTVCPATSCAAICGGKTSLSKFSMSFETYIKIN